MTVGGTHGNAKSEVVAAASLTAGALAMLIVSVVGLSWMDGEGRPLVNTREVDRSNSILFAPEMTCSQVLILSSYFCR